MRTFGQETQSPSDVGELGTQHLHRQQEALVDFNNLLIGSENPGPMAEFYTKLLGEPAYAGDGFTSWQIGSGHVSVGPHSEVKGKNAQPGRLIWNIESKDVKGDFERFKAAGATVIAEPYEFEAAPGSLIATFADPDGNYFQLTSPFEM